MGKNVFNDTCRAINKLVLPHLDDSVKKNIQSKRLEAIGAKKGKGKFVPLPELIKDRKDQKNKIAEQRRTQLDSGVITNNDIGLELRERNRK